MLQRASFIKKKIHRMGVLPGLTSKKPRERSDLRTNHAPEKDLYIKDYLNDHDYECSQSLVSSYGLSLVPLRDCLGNF